MPGWQASKIHHLSAGQDNFFTFYQIGLKFCTIINFGANFMTSFFRQKYRTLENENLAFLCNEALTCVGWPNGEKLASTCAQIWLWSKWTQVIASQRKSWPNGGQGFTFTSLLWHCMHSTLSQNSFAVADITTSSQMTLQVHLHVERKQHKQFIGFKF